MENQVQIFKNEELNLAVRVINNEDGSISVNAEDTAKGFGWTQTEIKNQKEYTTIKWSRINKFCKDLGFDHKCTKDDYIPESLFYRLGMKANNEKAQKYQSWLADDVIPNIRKHGAYMTNDTLEKALTNPDFIIKLATQLKEEQTKRKIAEEKNVILDGENKTLTADVLSWADDKIVNALIRKYGASLKEGKMGFSKAWINFKKELLYKYSININSRLTHYLNETGNKTKPKTLSVIRNKEEMTQCVKTAIALCKDNNVDVQDIIGKYIA